MYAKLLETYLERSDMLIILSKTFCTFICAGISTPVLRQKITVPEPISPVFYSLIPSIRQGNNKCHNSIVFVVKRSNNRTFVDTLYSSKM